METRLQRFVMYNKNTISANAVESFSVLRESNLVGLSLMGRMQPVDQQLTQFWFGVLEGEVAVGDVSADKMAECGLAAFDIDVRHINFAAGGNEEHVHYNSMCRQASLKIPILSDDITLFVLRLQGSCYEHRLIATVEVPVKIKETMKDLERM